MRPKSSVVVVLPFVPVTAMIGSYLGIYRGLPRMALVQDILQVLLQFPALESARQLSGYQKKILRQISLDSPRRLLPVRVGG